MQKEKAGNTKRAVLNRIAFIIMVIIPAATLAVGTAIIIANTESPPGETPQWAPPGETRTDQAQAGEIPTLVEFGDFQCPYCARFALGVLPALRNELIRNGTIRFEYRHYPFLGPESTNAAEAAECARDQNKFDAYHDRIYQITAARERITRDRLEQIATETGLEMAQFNKCTEERTHQGRVRADREYGRELGVRGTPSLVMDGEILAWNSYQDLVNQVRQKAAARTRTTY